MPEQQSSEQRHSQSHSHGHRRRRRHRHRRSQPLSTRSKLVIAVGAVAFVLIAAGLFSAASNMFVESKKMHHRIEMNQFVGFGGKTVIIMNPTDEDWGYTTVRLNDDYIAHCPELAKGMQFEIFLDQFRGGTNGVYDPKTQKIESVKIEPKGKEPIVWTRNLE